MRWILGISLVVPLIAAACLNTGGGSCTGDAVPKRIVSWTSTSSSPAQLAYNYMTDLLFLANGQAGAVQIFGAFSTLDGDDNPPEREIAKDASADQTGLAVSGSVTATGIALDDTR